MYQYTVYSNKYAGSSRFVMVIVVCCRLNVLISFTITSLPALQSSRLVKDCLVDYMNLLTYNSLYETSKRIINPFSYPIKYTIYIRINYWFMFCISYRTFIYFISHYLFITSMAPWNDSISLVENAFKSVDCDVGDILVSGVIIWAIPFMIYTPVTLVCIGILHAAFLQGG